MIPESQTECPQIQTTNRMKTNPQNHAFIKACGLILGIGLAAGAHCQATGVEFEQNATFALTANITDPALREKDENGRNVPGGEMVFENEWEIETNTTFTYVYEYASKITRVRVSNREILQELINSGDIEEPLAGWSLRFYDSPGPYDDWQNHHDDDDSGLYAVKGAQRVKVNIDIGEYGFAEQVRDNYRFTYNFNTERESVSESFNERILAEVFVSMNIGRFFLDFACALNSTEAGRFIRVGDDREFIIVPGAASTSSLVGSIEEDDEEPGVLTGSVRLAAARVIVTQ